MAMKSLNWGTHVNLIETQAHINENSSDRERGSISVLTIGLFLVTIAMLFLITDIATIAVAKRSLVHATESAALRAVQSLDRAAYYRGDTGVAIPIDCLAAQTRVIEELELWMQSDQDLRRPELQRIWLSDFYCAGNLVKLSTSARASLPFRMPASSLNDVELHASAAAQSDRARQ